jgi:hypothetical protein
MRFVQDAAGGGLKPGAEKRIPLPGAGLAQW